MRKNKTQKGITLIALIITIVVLLILAVVAIRAVQGDGIIAKAKEARTKTEEAQALEESRLSDYEIELAKNSPTNFDSNTMTETAFTKTTFLKDAKGKTFVVPAGYTVVKDDTTANTVEVDKGVVITDGTSQFVWVPVTTTIQAYGLGTKGNREPDVLLKEYDPDTDGEKDGGDNNPNNLKIINDILGTSYANSDDFLKDLQADFNAMATSVNKYGGFYVGRYEMSLNASGNAQSKYGATSAAEDSANTWYGLYAKAKTYTKDSVVSSMIWGSQYNAMMTWMGDAANTTIGANRNTDRTTGTCPTDVINNIYDLHGNSYEWTLEAIYTSSRVRRGGYCNGDYSPSHRSSEDPTDATSFVGSRLSLYIR